MGQLFLAEMLFEFPIFGPAATPFHGAGVVVPHDLRDHLGGVGGTRGRIHKTSCSVVISARRE
jgi:hypothetical protein